METSTPRTGSQLAQTAARHSASSRGEAPRVSSRDELAEMAAASQGNFEGKFESLDLAELAKKQPWWRTLFGQESGPSAEKYSVATQLLIGGKGGFPESSVGKEASSTHSSVLGLPWWLSWERICLQCGRPGFNPWFGKIPWRRERLPTPLFIILTVSFKEQKILILKYHISIISFIAVAFGVMSENIYLIQGHQKFLLCFLLYDI
ncbi:hypothetical protein FD755_016133 [Muntiacus reevesi]|uniref:FUN14 domain-containing protein 2 n=1 Tax=Muntiacus reevesi TaxID=9886 RepID=A0A5N3XEI0_MUNRE|nr:hypothetical protein FD755_016133 [Muntiacus reevesi]